ncbi:type II toxin-antitoxin system PemK/MazF family toxin [Thermoanaerobacterium sp. CMT5567-10]|uniref:type II toxin-antitoxin system PemK/MazF family toxin n=1 Tax=Thermoanaerobacterium sp. CMT5567-10 TaxID=3061989 RepID=UPI0026DF4D03|nr:type II toxin-antitoxin system PemK/MazF family toxin [Thermoanaerobacterium sp. CMT5567-10]WKV08061.1 type II toxin-antitoxin system PemK/MazF family toxin [Thermoanaerobacterium sp. CMT5567-10]
MPCPALPKNPQKSTHFEKGCIHWFDLTGNSDPSIASQKARPFIIISRYNPKSSRVIICPVSDMIHYLEKDTYGNIIQPPKLKYPYHAPLYKKDYPFLDKDSVVLLDQVYTVSKDELFEDWYMGQVVNTREIDEAIFYNYDLFASINEVIQDLLNSIENMHREKYSRK